MENSNSSPSWPVHTICSCYAGCFPPSSKPRNVQAELRMAVLCTTFTLIALYISGQMVAGILAESMSLVSDSSQGVVDVMTYAVSIYAQHYIDNTNDVHEMKKIGMYSAIWGAGTLIVISFFLSVFALWDLLDDEAPVEDPVPEVMMFAGWANLILDLFCIFMMQTGTALEGLIPWLLGGHKKMCDSQGVRRAAPRDALRRRSSDPGTLLVDDTLKSLGVERERASSVSDVELKKQRKPVNYGSAAQAAISEKDELMPSEASEDLSEEAKLASMLNVGSSLAHILADCARSCVIIVAASLILYGDHLDGQNVDCIASLVVNSFAIYMGISLILEAREISEELEEPMCPCLA